MRVGLSFHSYVQTDVLSSDVFVLLYMQMLMNVPAITEGVQ